MKSDELFYSLRRTREIDGDIKNLRVLSRIIDLYFKTLSTQNINSKTKTTTGRISQRNYKCFFFHSGNKQRESLFIFYKTHLRRARAFQSYVFLSITISRSNRAVVVGFFFSKNFKTNRLWSFYRVIDVRVIFNRFFFFFHLAQYNKILCPSYSYRRT